MEVVHGIMSGMPRHGQNKHIENILRECEGLYAALSGGRIHVRKQRNADPSRVIRGDNLNGGQGSNAERGLARNGRVGRRARARQTCMTKARFPRTLFLA